MHSDPFLRAALVAAARGWSVFPLVPGEKTPAIRGWEQRATVDRRQIHRWWAGESCYNIGVATGKSGLVVIDLDGGRGDRPPEQFAGAHNGHDVLAMLADAAGAEMPTRTYTVTTPSGCHLYFRTPPGIASATVPGCWAGVWIRARAEAMSSRRVRSASRAPTRWLGTVRSLSCRSGWPAA